MPSAVGSFFAIARALIESGDAEEQEPAGGLANRSTPVLPIPSMLVVDSELGFAQLMAPTCVELTSTPDPEEGLRILAQRTFDLVVWDARHAFPILTRLRSMCEKEPEKGESLIFVVLGPDHDLVEALGAWGLERLYSKPQNDETARRLVESFAALASSRRADR